jgi:hypothetical protein
MTLMAGGQSAPKAASTIVEQTWYFALPAKAEEVYRLRLHACDVLEKLGIPRRASHEQQSILAAFDPTFCRDEPGAVRQ